MDDDYQKTVTITEGEYQALIKREDMSGYQWHDAEKEKPKGRETIVMRGDEGFVMYGWFDEEDGLFTAYNDFPNMGPADVKFWAYVYIPPLKAKEEKKV